MAAPRTSVIKADTSVHRVADAAVESVRRAWMRALEIAKGAVSSASIAQEAPNWREAAEGLEQAMTDNLAAVAQRAAVALVPDLPATTTVRKADPVTSAEALFTLINQAAADWAKRHAGELVRGLSEESRSALRQALAQLYLQGVPQAEAARLIRPLIGLSEPQARAWINLRARLMERANDPEDALTLEMADRQLTDYRQRQLADRADTIARTETMKASNQGQQILWEQAQQQGYLDPTARRKWLVTPDERLCSICAPIPGRGPVGLQEPFTDGIGSSVSAPPAHPRCRCTTALVFG